MNELKLEIIEKNLTVDVKIKIRGDKETIILSLTRAMERDETLSRIIESAYIYKNFKNK